MDGGLEPYPVGKDLRHHRAARTCSRTVSSGTADQRQYVRRARRSPKISAESLRTAEGKKQSVKLIRTARASSDFTATGIRATVRLLPDWGISRWFACCAAFCACAPHDSAPLCAPRRRASLLTKTDRSRRQVSGNRLPADRDPPLRANR